MQKPNPIDFFFRDIAKFDTQNPIIANLLNQIQSQKITDQLVNDYSGKIPSIKDKVIKERIENLKKEVFLMIMMMMMVIFLEIYHHHLHLLTYQIFLLPISLIPQLCLPCHLTMMMMMIMIIIIIIILIMQKII